MRNFPYQARLWYAVLLTFTLTLGARTQAQTIDVIHTFSLAAGEGSLPYSGLVEDAAGNFYGTTYDGGTHNFGTVYRLSPNRSGGYTETILTPSKEAARMARSLILPYSVTARATSTAPPSQEGSLAARAMQEILLLL